MDRRIALSNVKTRMLETLILDKIKDEDDFYNNYQFGFKKGHSTGFVYSCCHIGLVYPWKPCVRLLY